MNVMAGRDVTPEDAGQPSEPRSDDREASSAFKRRQSQTNELEFLESLSENGTIVYERVLALGKQNRMRVKWGAKRFSLNVVCNSGANAAVCYGYPPSAYNQNLYTDFDSVSRNSNVPPDAVEALRTDALNTRLFAPAGRGTNLVCQTDRHWEEPQLAVLTEWLSTVIERIRESEPAPP